MATFVDSLLLLIIVLFLASASVVARLAERIA
jgi:hypothetical protein